MTLELLRTLAAMKSAPHFSIGRPRRSSPPRHGMQIPLRLIVALFIATSGCSKEPILSQPAISTPTPSSAIGRYQIIDATFSGENGKESRAIFRVDTVTGDTELYNPPTKAGTTPEGASITASGWQQIGNLNDSIARAQELEKALKRAK